MAEEVKELTTEEREAISAQAKKIMIRERVKLLCSNETPFFSSLVLSMPMKEGRGLETMATDGRYIYYDPEFVVKRTPEDIKFILLHEAIHPALGHLFRRGERDEHKWNIAADYADNSVLVNNGYKLPEDGLYNPDFMNLSVEQIYALLPDPIQLKLAVTIDSHDKWGEKKDGDGKGDGAGQNNDQDGSGGGQGQQDDTINISDAELEQVWKERLARAVNAARAQGKLPSNIESIVEDVLEPKLPWRELLRNFVQSSHKSNYRLFPPSKRYLHVPIYMPSCDGEFLEIAVAIDTSGSIGDAQLKAFVGELQGITDTFEDYRVHLYGCDARVHDYWELGPFEEWPKTWRGRGGTDFRPVFADIAEKGLSPSCLVYLTDSFGSYPDNPPDYPALWVVITPDAKVPWGDQIFMDLSEKE